MPQGDAPTFVNWPLDLDAYENWPHVPAPRSLTSFALPTRMQCWWTVQDEASNTITLPLCRAHHSLGRASPTLSAGSRCPGGRAAGECQGEPSDASARAHAAARAPPGGLQGTMPRRAPGTRERHQGHCAVWELRAPGARATQTGVRRAHARGLRPAWSWSGSGVSLDSGCQAEGAGAWAPGTGGEHRDSRQPPGPRAQPAGPRRLPTVTRTGPPSVSLGHAVWGRFWSSSRGSLALP